MGAIAISQPQIVRAHPLGGARPRLTLVPTGAEAGPRELERTMRLTRFGRLLVTLFVATALVATVVTVAGSFAGASGPGQTITVEVGDTMSQIAAERLPDLSIPDGVVAIQVANALSTSEIHAGQSLVIPTP